MAAEILRMDPDEWDGALALDGRVSIFHSAWWYRAWGIEPTVLGVWSDGRCVAGLCYATAWRMGLRVIQRPPLTPVCGPVFCDAGVRHRDVYGFRHQIVAGLLAATRRGQMNDFIIRLDDADVLPYVWSGYRCLARVTYAIPTGHSWQEHVSSHHRRNYRRGRRLLDAGDLSLQNDTRAPEAWALLRSTAYRGGFAFPQGDALEAWWRCVRARQAGELHMVTGSQGPVAVGLTVCDTQRTYYLAGGGSRVGGNLASAASALLMGHMIDRAQSAGRTFDFEGSLLPGVERYLRGWGGVQQTLLRVLGGGDAKSRIGAALWAWMVRRRSISNTTPTGPAAGGRGKDADRCAS